MSIDVVPEDIPAPDRTPDAAAPAPAASVAVADAVAVADEVTAPTAAAAVGAQVADAVPAPAAAPAVGADVVDAVPAPAAARDQNLETRAAERLHRLVSQGAEKLPGELGSTVSRLAVALLVFGSEVARKDREKPAQAAVTEAVALFRSLEDDDAAQQRAALESALSTFVTSTVGQKERDAVLETAEEAITLWRRVTSAGSGLATTDAVASLRELSGALRRTGREDAAAETESEARRLEA